MVKPIGILCVIIEQNRNKKCGLEKAIKNDDLLPKQKQSKGEKGYWTY